MEEKKEYKYSCEKCNFYTNARSSIYKHLISGLHLEGHRAIRCDKKVLDKCPNCDYTTKSNISMETHILNNHSTEEQRKTKFKCYCDYCDFGTFSQEHYEKHLDTKKHKQMLKLLEKNKVH
jgi:hypothetical protein